MYLFLFSVFCAEGEKIWEISVPCSLLAVLLTGLYSDLSCMFFVVETWKILVLCRLALACLQYLCFAYS